MPPTPTEASSERDSGSGLPSWTELLDALVEQVEGAGELPEVLYVARGAFAVAGLACNVLTDLRPVEYLQPLADARDAALAAADTLDAAPSAPPPPPLEPDDMAQITLAGAPGAAVLIPRMMAPVEVQRIADAVARLAGIMAVRLDEVAATASDTADRQALSCAAAYASTVAAGAGVDPRGGW